MNQKLMALVEAHLGFPRWHGLRVIAADGGGTADSDQELMKRTIANGVAFGLYLPGIEFSSPGSARTVLRERQMLFERLGFRCARTTCSSSTAAFPAVGLSAP